VITISYARVFWNIVSLNLKTFAQFKSWMISLFCLIALLATAAGLLGNFFLSETNIAGPVYIAIVDLDDSFETRMILSVITEQSSEYAEMLRFAGKTPSGANEALQNGDISAIITLPDNFGWSVLSGENLPFVVTYNAERPLSAALIRVVSNAFADMLRTSQMGVYVTLNYALEQDLSREDFDMIFMGVNMRFLGFVLGRGEMFVTQPQTVTGGVPIWQSYFIAAYIALMICAAFVMTDAIRRNFSRHCLVSLGNRGISTHTVFAACVFAYFLLFVVLNAAFWLLVANLPSGYDLIQFPMSASFFASVAVISLSLAAFAAMLTFVFESAFSAGAFASLFAVVSLFLSGGIVPVMYFSDGLRAASSFVWSTWGSELLTTAILDESILYQAVMSLVFGLIFSIFGAVFASRRGRCAK